MSVRIVRVPRGARRRALRSQRRRPTGGPRRTEHNPYAVAVATSAPVLLTALLFYFGWVRAQAEAVGHGYDVTLYEMTLQDFLLKSVRAVFVPMLLLVLLGLAAVAGHRRFVRPGLAPARRRVLRNRIATVLVRSWAGWAAVGVVLTVVGVGLAVPLCLTGALGCALYGFALRRRWPSSLAVRALLSVLLCLGLIWDVERMVGWFGTAAARDAVADPSQFASVTVYSAKDLRITAPGVGVTRIGEPESAYTYRYDGLLLLHRSGERLVLMPRAWNPDRSQVIVLRETDDVRFEFSRPRWQ